MLQTEQRQQQVWSTNN